MKAIITVVGNDKVGIIARVSKILAEENINILDISQTIMQNMVTMIMLVDVSEIKVNFNEISDIQHENIFNSMHRI